MKQYLLLVGALVLMMPVVAYANGKSVFGLYEKVLLPGVTDQAVQAKLDTGATTSSLDASEITVFEKNGQKWVRFTPRLKNSRQMELPLERNSRIKMRTDHNGNNGGTIKRPVVLMDICMGNRRYTMEVNLADRSRFEFPLLIGSNALIGLEAIVDPSKQYLHDLPDCP